MGFFIHLWQPSATFLPDAKKYSACKYRGLFQGSSANPLLLFYSTTYLQLNNNRIIVFLLIPDTLPFSPMTFWMIYFLGFISSKFLSLSLFVKEILHSNEVNNFRFLCPSIHKPPETILAILETSW